MTPESTLRSVTNPIAFDTVLDLCGDAHRRIILAALETEGRPLTMDDLRGAIFAYNHYSPVTDASEKLLTDILASLQHTHLPKLESAGVIDYDSEWQLVGPTKQFDQLQPHLAAILSTDPNLEKPIELQVRAGESLFTIRRWEHFSGVWNGDVVREHIYRSADTVTQMITLALSTGTMMGRHGGY